MIEMNPIGKAKAIIAQKDTDQELANRCSALTPEDIHTIRNTDVDLTLLPFLAIQELSQRYDESITQEILVSPIQEKEFALFKERLQQELDEFFQYQQAKANSEASKMDTLFFMNMAQDLMIRILQDETLLLSYFLQYQQELDNL